MKRGSGEAGGAGSEVPPAWTHIPLPRIDRLTTTQKTWHDACLVTLKAPTCLDTEAKNLAWAAMNTEGRSFINEFIRNSSLVSPEDKLSVGIHPRQPPHHIVPPHSRPELEPRAAGPRPLNKVLNESGRSDLSSYRLGRAPSS